MTVDAEEPAPQAATPSPGLVNAYHPNYAAGRRRLAPEGRRMIAHGVSRGLSSRNPAPAGAKESGWRSIVTPCLSPLRGSFMHLPCPTA